MVGIPNPEIRNNWIKDLRVIISDATRIVGSRDIYHKYLKIVKGNPNIQYPPDFHFWVGQNYADAICSGIRRHLGQKRSEYSLKRLLTSIKDEPWHITKYWYSSLFEPEPGKGWGVAEFESHFGKGAYFNPSIARADEKKLTELGAKIDDYVDKHIAHLGRTRANEIPKFRDIDVFLTEFGEILRKYHLLLTATGGNPLPVPQSDWTDIFTKPWISRSSNSHIQE